MSKFFKLADSNYLVDFVAGGDPTGRATLELSKRNDKHHLAHRLSGDLGGFIVGSAATTALTSGAMFAASKLLKKNPHLSKVLSESARDSLIILNPKKAKTSLQNFSEGFKLVDQDMKNIETLRTEGALQANIGSIEKLVHNRKLHNLAKSMPAHEKEVEKFTKKTGTTPVQAAQAGTAAAAGLTSAAVGGVLNAVSAESQYQVGQEFRKKAAVNSKELFKKFIVPSLIAGPIVGAGVTAVASKNKEEFKRDISKGIVAGVVGDIATGAAIGLWNQRKNLHG